MHIYINLYCLYIIVVTNLHCSTAYIHCNIGTSLNSLAITLLTIKVIVMDHHSDSHDHKVLGYQKSNGCAYPRKDYVLLTSMGW